MSSVIVRSRLASALYRRRGRCLSSDAPSSFQPPHKESIFGASQTLVSDRAPPSSSQGVEAPEAYLPSTEKRSWSFFMYTLFAAFTGVTATAGYATYAYSLCEVDEKTRLFRDSANSTSAYSDSTLVSLKGLLYSAAITVPAKAIELYLDLRRVIEQQVHGFTEPTSDKLLPELHPLEQHVFTLVLDLNETLVYSDWKRDRGWRTFKRPGVDAFLEHLAKFYEIVIYSDQLNMYVDPVVERLDSKQCIRYRLSRGATKYQDGKHFRDLSKLNRNPGKILYISGHALESCLQPENCVQIQPWKLEGDDTTLLDLIPFLECEHQQCVVASRQPSDIRPVLASYDGTDIAKEFIKRSVEHQRQMREQRQSRGLWRH